MTVSDEIRWARSFLKNLADGNPQLANSFKQVLKLLDDHARLTERYSRLEKSLSAMHLRRDILGNKLIRRTITPKESDELTNIDSICQWYLSSVNPLPFDILVAAENLMNRGGISDLRELVQSLAERCARQSEMLGIRAERDDGYRLLLAEISTIPGCNCGAGTAFGPMAGHWPHCKINTNEEKQSS